MDILTIARMGRAEQIALRDKLNALIDNPGADETPFRCTVERTDYLVACLTAGRARVAIDVCVRPESATKNILLTPAEARRLAARVQYLANQAEDMA